MSNPEYKPERSVTSAKIKRCIIELVQDYNYEQVKNHQIAGSIASFCYGVMESDWSRMWKRRLPESRGWVRGFKYKTSGSFTMNAIAISNYADDKLIEVRLVIDADEEFNRISVLECMFA